MSESLAFIVVTFISSSDEAQDAIRELIIEGHPEQDEIVRRIERLGIRYRKNESD